MATEETGQRAGERRYVVLRETDDNYGEGHPAYYFEQEVDATSAEQARQRVANILPPADVDKGVTLIAVPARNWRTGRGTLKAETQRRIRSA